MRQPPAVLSTRPAPTMTVAALLEGPCGVVLHLRAEDGALTQLPLTRDALAEVAALSAQALRSPSGLPH